MNKYFIYTIILFLLNEVKVYAQTVEDINIGSYSADFTYAHSLDLSNSENSFIVYKLSLACYMHLIVDNFGSSIESSAIEIQYRDEFGYDGFVNFNDGSFENPASPNKLHGSLTHHWLPPGDYYVMVFPEVGENSSSLPILQTNIRGVAAIVDVKPPVVGPFPVPNSGQTRGDAIQAGTYSDSFFYSEARNLDGYRNMDQGPGKDVFYRFTLEKTMDVKIHHSGSSQFHDFPIFTDISLYKQIPYEGTTVQITEEYIDNFPNTESCFYVRRLEPGNYFIASERVFGNTIPDEQGVIITNIEGIFYHGYELKNPIYAGEYTDDFGFIDTHRLYNEQYGSADDLHKGYYKLILNSAIDIDITLNSKSIFFNSLGISILDNNGNQLRHQTFDQSNMQYVNGGQLMDMEVDGLLPGTYYVEITNINPPSTELEYAVINVAINGQIANPIGNTKENAIEIGLYGTGFSYIDRKDLRLYSDTYPGNLQDVFYKIETLEEMNLHVSHCGSAIEHTFITLIDENGAVIGNSISNRGEDCYVATHGTFSYNNLPAGIYYIISEGVSSDGTIVTQVQGYKNNDVYGNKALSLSSNKNYVMTIVPTTATSVIGDNPSIGQAHQTISYYDGLGRPEEVVKRGFAPNKKDLVYYQGYNSAGIEEKAWLPFAHDGAGEFVDSVHVNIYANLNYRGDPFPFSKTIYNPSPLNRVSEEYGVGADWYKHGKSVRQTEMTNVVEDSKLNCILYKAVGTGTYPQLSKSGNYATGQLFVTEIRDENDNPSYEFKDKLGRRVLWRRIGDNNENHDTYYVYDDFGNLCFVLPPSVANAEFLGENDDVFKQYAYLYRYDERNRLVEKKIPGKGWEWIVYNRNDQPVLTQDAVQRENNKWSYTKYDAFGRVSETGIHTALYATQAAAQVAAYSHATTTGKHWESRTEDIDPITPTGYTRYTNDSFPVSDLQPLTINYYDDHLFEGADTEELEAKDIIPSIKTKTLLTGVKVYKDDGTSPLLTVNYYDDRARLIQSASQNHLGGTDYVTHTYSFVGELLTSKREHKASPTGGVTTILTTNDYDHVGRLLSVRHRINTGDEVTLMKNAYNEIGQLVRKSVGGDDQGSNFHTDIAYDYNIRSWLKSANSPQFSYNLHYNNPTQGATPKYNGNISEQHWTQQSQSTKHFTYAYDKLNRLIDGNSVNGSMREQLEYDNMGNITSLIRDNHTTGTTYTYIGNQLMSLSGAITGSYTYDPNGNALTDRTGMMFTYNHLNLPKSVTDGNVTVSYLYDALGTKLRKTSTQSGQREYVGGIEYGSSGIELIRTGEGIAYRNILDNTYTYRYNLTDHLGNVRATIYRHPNPNIGVEVLQADDYYPFGKHYVVLGENNRYLYNGKELQDELATGTHTLGSSYTLEGQYDYGARFYDAEIGRWNVVDPLAEQMRRYSPYNYTFNNPIRFIDPDGMAPRPGQHGMYYDYDEQRYRDEKGENLDFWDALAYHQQREEQDGESKQTPWQKISRSVVFGDPGGVDYDGAAWWGTNFVGPGPDVDPRELGLKPKDMLDKAAFDHDVSYYLAGTGGIHGALNEIHVSHADKMLANEAFKIMQGYFKGEIDHITGRKITERTYNMATAVYLAFKPIEKKKYGEIHTRTAINSFYQNFLFNWSKNILK